MGVIRKLQKYFTPVLLFTKYMLFSNFSDKKPATIIHLEVLVTPFNLYTAHIFMNLPIQPLAVIFDPFEALAKYS